MTWDQVECRWHDVKGKLKAEWRELTDADIAALSGNREELIGRFGVRYQMRREDAEKQLDAWLKTI